MLMIVIRSIERRSGHGDAIGWSQELGGGRSGDAEHG